MGIFDFFKKKPIKDNRYNIDDATPPVIKSETTSSDLFKRDLSGLEAYF